MGFPDFFIAGAPKAGTTALHVALARHPQLFLSGVKEPKFFLTDESPPPARGGPGDAQTYREYVWRRSDYEALFEPAPAGTLRGESTTLYLRDPDGNGIELYRDRPREEWPRADDGEVTMYNAPLDLEALLAEASS